MRIGVIDIETTGLDAKNGDILQVGMVVYDEGDEHEVFQVCQRTYFTDRPQNEIRGAIEVNKLTSEKIKEIRDAINNGAGATYALYFKDDLDFWQSAFNQLDMVVAHNIKFDLGWLKEHGIKEREFYIQEKKCTQNLMSKKVSHTKRWSLKKSIEHFFPGEYDASQAHTALYDARLCARLYKKLTSI